MYYTPLMIEKMDKEDAKVRAVLSIIVATSIGLTWLITRSVESDKRLEALAQQKAAFNNSVEESYAAPQETDLNMDGMPDLVLNLGDGRKVPLYGVSNPDGEGLIYLSGAKMRDRFPDRPVDYDGIAARLNGQ